MTGTGIKHLKRGEDDWGSNQTLIKHHSLRQKKVISHNVLERTSPLQSICMLSPSPPTCWHADASITGYRSHMRMEAAPPPHPTTRYGWQSGPQNICPLPLRRWRVPPSATVGPRGYFSNSYCFKLASDSCRFFCSPLRYPLPSCSRYYRISLCNPHIAGRQGGNVSSPLAGTCCSWQSEVNPRG